LNNEYIFIEEEDERIIADEIERECGREFCYDTAKSTEILLLILGSTAH